MTSLKIGNTLLDHFSVPDNIVYFRRVVSTPFSLSIKSSSVDKWFRNLLDSSVCLTQLRSISTRCRLSMKVGTPTVSLFHHNGLGSLLQRTVLVDNTPDNPGPASRQTTLEVGTSCVSVVVSLSLSLYYPQWGMGHCTRLVLSRILPRFPVLIVLLRRSLTYG